MSAAPGRPKQARTAGEAEGTPVSAARPPAGARTAGEAEGTPVSAARQPDDAPVASTTSVETGSMGRVAYARIAPNEDLVQGVEKLCLAEGFQHAFVRGALGSLVDACVGTLDGGRQYIRGPAVEIVSLAGEVRLQADGSLSAALSGVVADPQGCIFGGPFVAGANPICMTFEVTLEEWLPAPSP